MRVTDVNHKLCQCSFTSNGNQFITVNGFKIAERRHILKLLLSNGVASKCASKEVGTHCSTPGARFRKRYFIFSSLMSYCQQEFLAVRERIIKFDTSYLSPVVSHQVIQTDWVDRDRYAIWFFPYLDFLNTLFWLKSRYLTGMTRMVSRFQYP